MTVAVRSGDAPRDLARFGDALDTLAANPTTDAEIVKLVATYTRLCPEAAAKHHAK